MTPSRPDPTIGGHPQLEAVNDAGQVNAITVCCECGELRTVLWLNQDRWYCSKCKAGGDSRPRMIPIA